MRHRMRRGTNKGDEGLLRTKAKDEYKIWARETCSKCVCFVFVLINSLLSWESAGNIFLLNNLRTFTSTWVLVAEITVRKGTGYTGASGTKLIRPRPADERGSGEDA